jgi:hypothetical protein
VAIGTAICAALGVLAYVLGPLGFPLRYTGLWPACLYDAAMALAVMLALGAPVAAARSATRRAVGSTPTGVRVRQGAMAGLCTGVAAALVVTVLSTATIALLPYYSGLRNWAADHIGQWAPIFGQVTTVVGPRLGYVAGNSAFAAGYLLVLLLGPLFGCGFGAWAGWSAAHPRPARSQRLGDGPTVPGPSPYPERDPRQAS